MSENTHICPDCKLRVEYIYRKFLKGEGHVGFTQCPRRQAGADSCFDLYCDYIRRYKLGPLKAEWPHRIEITRTQAK